MDLPVLYSGVPSLILLSMSLKAWGELRQAPRTSPFQGRSKCFIWICTPILRQQTLQVGSAFWDRKQRRIFATKWDLLPPTFTSLAILIRYDLETVSKIMYLDKKFKSIVCSSTVTELPTRMKEVAQMVKDGESWIEVLGRDNPPDYELELDGWYSKAIKCWGECFPSHKENEKS